MGADGFEIRVADLADRRVATLIETHAMTARGQTGRDSAHALDLADLETPGTTVWAAWLHDSPVGVAALRRLSPGHGEVKSMHTAQAARRSGVGRALLGHLIDVARNENLTRLSLETGSWPYFAPARALYASSGFVERGPFGDYAPDPNSVFMTLTLR
ncbi:MAG TPA: GNAT family N-acetyltransferase [Caulobacteraceae bacterium]|jgi:putative acetyltransferase|nr:GNAT family N-acetyltransferase [Caulobacteraceae bacterium]